MGGEALHAFGAAVGIAAAVSLAVALVVSLVTSWPSWRAGATGVAAWVWRWRKPAGWTVAVVAGIPVALWLIWWLPEQVPQQPTETQLARYALVNQIRRTWIGVVGGAVALGTLWLAWVRSRAALDTARAALKTAETTEQGQITERFTRAIDQLGALKGEAPNIELRLGGIYALEQIAKDAPDKYHWQVVEVLCAYVRANHRFDSDQVPVEEPEGDTNAAPPPAPPPRLDVQATLTVIGRRDTQHDAGRRIDLSETDLRGYDLNLAHLEGAKLWSAHLEGADLPGAHLEGANLTDVHLEGADLRSAHLEDAPLMYAHLEGADLRRAHLEGAKLWSAHLEGADLRRAHLEGADLSGAELGGARLERAYLTNAHLEGADLSGAELDDALRPEDDIPGWKSHAGGRLRRVADDS